MDTGEDLQKERRRHARSGGLGYWWPLFALGAALVLYFGFAGLSWWVQADAYKFAGQTMREFQGDEVQALLALVHSDTRPLAERDRAVHALGQIGDRRALPLLASYYTGEECDHARFLCQKELRKAIDRCSGRSWAARWLPSFPPPPEF